MPKFQKKENVSMQKQGGFQNGNTNNLHFIYCRRLYDQSSTGGNGKMKYTLYFKTHLTREIMQKADALNIGMVEEVLDNLISWHDICSEEIPAALDFIRDNFGHITITVAEEYWHSISYCFTLETMEIELLPDGEHKIHYLIKKSQAQEVLRDLKGMYSKADALFIDTIIDAVGEVGFWKLVKYGLVECCGEFNGRKLYAI